MDIVGYSDRLSVAPGQIIQFMVSSRKPTYEAAIVRLIHGDDNPQGPGFNEEVLHTAVDGEYVGREQVLPRGSYVKIPDVPTLQQPRSFTLTAWIYPTTPRKGVPQGLLTRLVDTVGGYGLFIDADGSLALWIGDGSGRVERLRTGQPMRSWDWYFVAATFDADSGMVSLYQEPQTQWPLEQSVTFVECSTDVHAPAAIQAPFLIAASWERFDGSNGTAGRHFNGKIDSPCVFGQALERDTISALHQGRTPSAVGSLIAAWDFTADISSHRIRDAGPNGLHGETINTPMRAVTGRNWTGNQMNFALASHEYGAIHFHDDDLDDAGWDVDFEFRVSDDMKSGIYAARLRSGESEDYIPFFVRPPRGTSSSRIAFLVPTVSYIIYANEHLSYQNPYTPPMFDNIEELLQPQDDYIIEQNLIGCYDRHNDGSGVVYSSRLRPILNMRPKYNLALVRAPHQLGADLHITDWLEAKGYDFDVITDEDLHYEGKELLAHYRVVVTGSHPEYWTAPMYEGLQEYLNDGGRMMYLGGNGFYWVTGVDPERPHIFELRRGHTDEFIWESGPGEYYHSTTGEIGGTWRLRGRPGQKLAGVGFTAQGFDYALPYVRQPGSYDPRAAFIFEGIGDEPIGDFGLVMGGAAGFEIDRLDYGLGTPPHALLLAAATGFSDSYDGIHEDWIRDEKLAGTGIPQRRLFTPWYRGSGGTVNPLVRCDMVYFEGPNGGAVFSTGSIAYSGSLSYNHYDNNVSRLTENVLRRFISDEPIAAQELEASRAGD